MGRRRLTRELGSAGLDAWGGYVQEDFLEDWRSTRKKVESVEEMLFNSPVIGALRLAVEMPIRDVDWQFTSTEGEDDPRLELVQEAFDNLSHSWNDHISEALLFAFYGWSKFTITYERDGSRLLWRKFKMLGHDTVMRWLMAEDGGLEGLQQYPHLWPDPIPIERMLLYRFRKIKNNPEGESILRPAWIPWYYAKNIMSIEAIGVERNLAGLPKVTLPEHADTSEGSDDMKKAEKIVRNIRMDEQAGIVEPFGWEVSLLGGGGQGASTSKTADAGAIIERHEKRMLMAALAQFIILGMDQVGSLALSKDQTDFFTMAVNAVADIIGETFSKFAIPRLLRLNGLPEDGIMLEHSPAGDIDTVGLSDVLSKLSPNITWTADDEVWLRSLLRMPERSVEEIEAGREEARQRQMEMIQARPNPFARDDSDVDRFVSDRAPDDDERRTLEQQWQAKMLDFLRKQKRRVMRGAEEMR